jgi:Leu/Phe-tRNA-protein transferase
VHLHLAIEAHRIRLAYEYDSHFAGGRMGKKSGEAFYGESVWEEDAQEVHIGHRNQRETWLFWLTYVKSADQAI